MVNPAQLYLALPATFISLVLSAYTIISLLCIIFTSPLRLCIAQKLSIRKQVQSLLEPFLRLQYRSVFHESRHRESLLSGPYLPPPANSQHAWYGSSDGENLETRQSDGTGSLVLVCLLCPFAATVASFAACIFAFFWIFSTLTANELADGGRKRGFDDGLKLARGLVGSWVWWLDGSLFTSPQHRHVHAEPNTSA